MRRTVSRISRPAYFNAATIALLVALVVNPSCALLCQARTCASLQGDFRHIDCHEQSDDSGSDVPSNLGLVVPASSHCASHDQVMALPASNTESELKFVSSRTTPLQQGAYPAAISDRPFFEFSGSKEFISWLRSSQKSAQSPLAQLSIALRI
jgi:hypothetical protein